VDSECFSNFSLHCRRQPADVASFAPNFVTPRVHQASLSLERELADRFAAGISYMCVHGQNLIRARDVNLPTPADVTYPVYDDAGNFLGAYYDVPSFSNWQMTKSMTCPLPPCINPLARPISQLGAMNEFDGVASSVYHGLTVSLHRPSAAAVQLTPRSSAILTRTATHSTIVCPDMTHGLYFRMAYKDAGDFPIIENCCQQRMIATEGLWRFDDGKDEAMALIGGTRAALGSGGVSVLHVAGRPATSASWPSS
jgi:hypothetical protein